MGNASIIPTIDQDDGRGTPSSPASLVDQRHGPVPELTVASVNPPNPAVSAYAALAGYGGTGHSPADAS